MCGLAGFLGGAPLPRPEAEARLWAMIGTLRHRGPDDQGVWSDGRAGLASARLKIIDLSPAGHQPMASPDGQVWIAYNGEVYNFAELRPELEALGYPFRGRSDTEVIVNGWHAWGTRVFGRLRGMFALAIWDRRSRSLILARDRIGKKPLYYTVDHNGIRFGSEIKAVLAWPGAAREPNLAAIDAYLSLGYVPAPLTAFAGIRKLPAAHYLTCVLAEDGGPAEPAIARYWSLPEPQPAARRTDTVELERELRAHLEEAVKLRLVSDVPLGAFLSGGIDSSSVVAVMARAGGGRVKTFSIGFAAAEYDETRWARVVAERYGTEHEEFTIEPDAVAVLPRLVWHYGEPFADPSAVPTWYVSEIARRKVTVALNGDGGDECFLGYNRYRAMRHLARLDRLPGWSRTGLDRLLALAPAELQRRFRIPRLRRLIEPDRHPGHRYAFSLVPFTDDDKAAGYGPALSADGGTSALDLFAPFFAGTESLVDAANRADIHTYLPDDLMVKVDVASMAHGLEARSPLLDHVLLEWAARIPPEIKMKGGVTKALFKRAMASYLPREILYRPKMGFGVPIDRWFRDELKELAYDTLLSASARQRGLFHAGWVAGLLDEHCRGRRDHHTRLWALLMLELWFRMWIDAPDTEAPLQPIEDRRREAVVRH